MRTFRVREKHSATVARNLAPEEAVRIFVEITNCSGWDYVIEPEMEE